MRITGKREDGFHNLASLFHVSKLMHSFFPLPWDEAIPCWIRSIYVPSFTSLFTIYRILVSIAIMTLWYALLLLQVISLGDKIKFSLSHSKLKDHLSTNVPGVPLDERNLVKQNLSFVYCFILLKSYPLDSFILPLCR